MGGEVSQKPSQSSIRYSGIILRMGYILQEITYSSIISRLTIENELQNADTISIGANKIDFTNIHTNDNLVWLGVQ